MKKSIALLLFLAMLLQSMYGAVDLLIVGQFASSADVSAVSTGSQIMMTMTNLIASFAMGATILLARQIGEGKAEEGVGRVRKDRLHQDRAVHRGNLDGHMV